MTSGAGQPLGAADPRQAGPYRLEARLGQGGTGAVYLGRAKGARAVAVKVLHPQLAGDEAFRRRLAEELAAVGRGTGPGLPATVAADPAAETPWLASPYVPGVSLAEAVSAHGPLPLPTLRVLGAGLAEALAALHSAGLVHTTLQPHKVLLAADGPRLTAFAAARAVAAADPSRTVSAADGRFLAPEQAGGHHVGPETDVFAWGGLLVFAATGRPPFRAGPGAETLRSIVEDQPELTGVPEPLHRLIAAALAKAPEQRPTAEYLLRRLTATAQETASWLPEPLAAQAAAPTESLWTRRRTLLLAAGGAGVLAATGTATALLLTASDGSGGRRDDAQVPADAVLRPAHTIDLGKTRHGSRLTYSPDGKRLAVTLKDRVTIWDAGSRRRLTDLVADDTLLSVAVDYGPGGLLALAYHRTFTLANPDMDLGGITVWDTSGDRPERVAELKSPSQGMHLRPLWDVALSPDGRLVAGARNTKKAIGMVEVWDVRSGKKKAELFIGKGKGKSSSAARSVAFSPDGKLLAAGWGVDLEGGVALFRTDSWEAAGELPLKDTDAFGITSLAFTPDGRTLAGTFGGLVLWDVPKRKLIGRIGNANGKYQTLAVSPDGRTVAVGGGGEGSGGDVVLYDVRTRQRKVAVPAGRSGTSDLAFRPDGRTLAGTVTTTKMLTAVQLWTVE